jgi:hypothetical protein
MKQSELRQLIREEIKGALINNPNQKLKGKTIESFKSNGDSPSSSTSDTSDNDLFTAEYRSKKIKIEGKFLKRGQERNLLQKLKKFNLGSGHEEMKLSKIDDDNFVFRLETYSGGPVQTIYFERVK